MPMESLTLNKYSFKSDIYSIGMILYEMLMGRLPWDCTTEKELLCKMTIEPISYPHISNDELRKFISRACQINEQERLGINDLHSVFSGLANPQYKEKRMPVALRPPTSWKTKASLMEISNTTTQTSLSSQKKG
jgi:serine/threonine protein kinase